MQQEVLITGLPWEGRWGSGVLVPPLWPWTHNFSPLGLFSLTHSANIWKECMCCVPDTVLTVGNFKMSTVVPARMKFLILTRYLGYPVGLLRELHE